MYICSMIINRQVEVDRDFNKNIDNVKQLCIKYSYVVNSVMFAGDLNIDLT